MTDATTSGVAALSAATLLGASTPRDIVRLYLPSADDVTCDHLLWEKTCFPVGSIDRWWGQLDELLAEGSS